jgi:hypothetical protein
MVHMAPIESGNLPVSLLFARFLHMPIAHLLATVPLVLHRMAPAKARKECDEAADAPHTCVEGRRPYQTSRLGKLVLPAQEPGSEPPRRLFARWSSTSAGKVPSNAQESGSPPVKLLELSELQRTQETGSNSGQRGWWVGGVGSRYVMPCSRATAGQMQSFSGARLSVIYVRAAERCPAELRNALGKPLAKHVLPGPTSSMNA